jgi:hypothetical protein
VGLRNDTVVRERIDAMTREERREFIRLMFNLLESTGAKTLTDLHHGKGKIALTLIKAYRDLPEKDQETAGYLWEKLTGGDRREHKAPAPPATAGSEGKPHRNRRKRGRIKVTFFPLLVP